MCPYCKSFINPRKRGFYKRPADGKRIQRFKCRDCRRSFSSQRFGIEFRLRKRSNLQRIYRLLCRGVSQRAIAEEFELHRDSIGRRIVRYGACAKHNLEVYRSERTPIEKFQIDEMISFEHTKCKPVTIPIAVESETRKILALSVGKIAAFGHLAAISRKKYGPRPCERSKVLNEVFKDIKSCSVPTPFIKSDESKYYPPLIVKYFPGANHFAYKGRKGCVVGQGELKAGGFDPIFSLNHSYAMFRDNLKRLTRRTWCTTKLVERLQLMLYMYAWFHNLRLEKMKKPVSLIWTRTAPIK